MNSFWKLFFIFSLFLLIACGGTGEEPPTAAPIEQAITDPEPTVEEVAVKPIEEETAVAPTPTAIPTEAPIIEPEPTATQEPIEEVAAPTTGDFEIVGTAEATVDGEQMTWYMLSGELDGAPQASSTWQKTSDGQYLLMLGGFDTPDVPFERLDMNNSLADFGEYIGSMFILTAFYDPATEALATESLTGDLTSLILIPDLSQFEGGGANGMFVMSGGNVEVTSINETADGFFELEGTFSGELMALDASGDTLSVENGRFSVSNILFIDLAVLE